MPVTIPVTLSMLRTLGPLSALTFFGVGGARPVSVGLIASGSGVFEDRGNVGSKVAFLVLATLGSITIREEESVELRVMMLAPSAFSLVS